MWPKKTGQCRSLPDYPKDEYKSLSRAFRRSTCGAQSGQADAGGGALAQRFAAEAEELGGAAAGARVDLAGALDEAGSLDQAPEVLLVQRHAGERLDTA